MRMFGLVGLVIVLAVLALLLRHQIASQRWMSHTVPHAVSSEAPAAMSDQPDATVRQQARKMQRDYRQALDRALHQPRDIPDEAQ